MAGLCKSQQRPKEQADSPLRLGVKAAHLLGDILNPQEIEHRQHQIIECRHDQRGRTFPHLAVILAQGDISSPVEPVFNAPMRPHERQEPPGTGLVRGEAADAVDRLGPFLSALPDRPRETKDLFDPRPPRLEDLVQFGGSGQFADFHAPMPLGTGASLPPISAIGRRLGEKEAQVLFQGRLIGLGNQELVAAEAGDVGATPALRVHGISGHDPPRNLRRGQQGGIQRDLVAFVGDRVLSQDNPGLSLIEGSYMLAGLIGGGMRECASQGLPVQGHMGMLLACLPLGP